MRGLPLIAAGLLWACVPVEDVKITQGTISSDQRTAVVVYVSPSPWITAAQDTKAGSAAKFIPGVGQLVQSVQDEASLRDAEDLRRYFTQWPGSLDVGKLLQEALRAAGYPGRVILIEKTGIPADVLRRFNLAQDALEWRTRYYTAEPADLLSRRNYSALLELDRDLVLEVNLQYGVKMNNEGNTYPALDALSRLYRARTMKLVWVHEDHAENTSDPVNIYEFKAEPKKLSERLDNLRPSLVQTIAASLKQAIPAGAEPMKIELIPGKPPPPLPATADKPVPPPGHERELPETTSFPGVLPPEGQPTGIPSLTPIKVPPGAKPPAEGWSDPPDPQ